MKEAQNLNQNQTKIPKEHRLFCSALMRWLYVLLFMICLTFCVSTLFFKEQCIHKIKENNYWIKVDSLSYKNLSVEEYYSFFLVTLYPNSKLHVDTVKSTNYFIDRDCENYIFRSGISGQTK